MVCGVCATSVACLVFLDEIRSFLSIFLNLCDAPRIPPLRRSKSCYNLADSQSLSSKLQLINEAWHQPCMLAHSQYRTLRTTTSCIGRQVYKTSFFSNILLLVLPGFSLCTLPISIQDATISSPSHIFPISHQPIHSPGSQCHDSSSPERLLHIRMLEP
jgi:hypothetical protein